MMTAMIFRPAWWPRSATVAASSSSSSKIKTTRATTPPAPPAIKHYAPVTSDKAAPSATTRTAAGLASRLRL